MAKRQDSGSNSAHQNQRPNSQNEEDAVPENTENVRGIGSDDDDADDLDDEAVDDEEDDAEENEGSF